METQRKRRELAKAVEERQKAFDAWDAEVVKFKTWPPIVDEAALARMEELKAAFDEADRRWRTLLGV